MQTETIGQRPFRKFAIDFRFEDSDIIVSFKGVWAPDAQTAINDSQLSLKEPAKWACIGFDRDDR